MSVESGDASSPTLARVNKLIQLARNLLGLDDDVQALSSDQEREKVARKVRWRIGVGAALVISVGAVALGVVSSLFAGNGHRTVVPREVLSTSSPATSSIPESGSISGNGRSVLIHVVGAVRSPGVYTLEAGSRVVDAIMLAGGWREAAQLCNVNMARTLNDGEQITIPSGSCEIGADSSSTAVSLNRGTLAQLDALPGVGATLAQRIIDWRKANGGFTRLEQLNEVSGISDKLYAQLKPLVVL